MRYWRSKQVRGTPTVGIGVATYLNDEPRRRAALRSLLASFQAQTYPHWRLVAYHDGPASADVRREWEQEAARDSRLSLVETPSRKQQFGHPWRQRAIEELAGTCPWLLLTNDDNWYAPVFLEWLLAEATAARPPAQLAYCDMVHSHRLWQPLVTQPRYRHLDLGGLLVAAALARRVPFDKTSFNADGDWIDRLVRVAGPRLVVKVRATLFVHN